MFYVYKLSKLVSFPSGQPLRSCLASATRCTAEQRWPSWQWPSSD